MRIARRNLAGSAASAAALVPSPFAWLRLPPLSRLLAAGCLVSACLLTASWAGPPAVAQQSPAPSEEAAPEFRGRLPAYYAQVVSLEQRKQIYDVQAKYHERIQTLEEQLAALRHQRDQEMEAVLSDEQRQQIAEMREAARRRRAARSTSASASSAAESDAEPSAEPSAAPSTAPSPAEPTGQSAAEDGS